MKRARPPFTDMSKRILEMFTPPGLPKSRPSPIIPKPQAAAPAPVPTAAPKQPSKPPQVFRSAQTKELSGITTPTGEVLLGLTPKQVRKFSAGFAEDTKAPPGTEFPTKGETADQEALRVTTEFLKKQREEKIRKEIEAQQMQQRVAGSPEIQQALLDIGLTEEQKNRVLDLGAEGWIGTAATFGAGAGAGIIGAKVGAGIGTAIAPGVGSIAGGVAGAAAGFTTGIVSKITYSNVKTVSSGYGIFQGSRGNVDWIINQANSRGMPPGQAVDMFDEESANLYAVQRQLKELTKGNLNKLLAPGAVGKLGKVDAYILRLPEKERMLREAIASPDPNKIINEVNIDIEE